jgi:hypothetical protein
VLGVIADTDIEEISVYLYYSNNSHSEKVLEVTAVDTG